MALPFGPYEGQDLTSYEEGNKFLPREFYSLGFPNTPPPSITNASTGITNTQAASPYIWPPQGGGGGGGGGSNNKFGLNLDTLKSIDMGRYVEKGGPGDMYGGNYVKDSRDIAQTEGGIWKDVKTGQNVYHANMPQIKGLAGTVMDFMSGKDKNRDIYEGTWTGAEWDEDFDPTVAGRKLNTIQRWKAKKEFKAAEAQKAEAEKARADIAAHKPYLQYQSAQNRAANTGGWQSGMAKDEGFMTGAGTSDEMGSFAQGGRIGFKDGLSAYQLFKLKELGYPGAGSNPGSYGGLGVLRDILKLHKYKDGGRIGYRNGEFVDENIEGPGFDENVMMASDENNTRLLENLFEKYLELGFSPEDAEIKAMEEFELMSQGQSQDQGIASLV